MKLLYKVLSSLALVGATTFGLVACDIGGTDNITSNSGTTQTPTTPITSTTESEIPNGYVKYVVKTQALSGLPLAGVRVKLSKTGEEPKTVYSNEYGEASFIIPEKGNWSISCMDIDGYTVDEQSEGQVTDLTACETTIKFKPQLLPKDGESDFTVNSQMVDYTFTGYDYGNNGEETSYTLSELFDNGTELVCLNFWYTTCSYCILEFPYMLESYDTYEEKGVKIIGINPGSAQNDDKNKVDAFAKEYKLDIMTTINDTTMVSNFGLSGYPTSVFIDRYGTITLIESGAVTSTEKWNNLFEKYVGDDYVPTYEASGSNIKPDTVFPGSNALKDASVSNKDLSVKFENEERTGYEFNWSWEVSEDGNSIKPSNEGINSSYSILWMNVTIPAGKVLALDYKASCDDSDFLGILFDNKAICQLSGNSKEFTTQYLYVAGKEEENIDIEFFFYKDSSTSLYDDTIYINNIRLIEQSEIQGSMHVIRQAAYGEVNSITQEWTKYITPVYNEEDGFYHVGTEDGPLLLAALLDTYTHFDTKALNEYLADDADMFLDKDNDIDYGEILFKYASYCQNSTLSIMDLPTDGLTAITQELKEALDYAVAKLSGITNENQWLELCVYIDEYGTPGNEIGNPIVGLSTLTAFDSVVNYDTELSFEDKEYNYIKFDFALVPRGYLFKITPEVSGVYRIYGASGDDTICFFYTGEGERTEDSQAYVDRDIYKMYDDETYGVKVWDEAGQKYVYCNDDFTQYMYYEAGKTYYIAPCFFYTDEVDQTLRFYIDYVGTSYTYLAQASEDMFTYELNSDGSMGDVISVANVDVKLGDDGYYHPVKDGQEITEQFIYADFLFTTGIFTDKSLYTRVKYFQNTYGKDEGTSTQDDDANEDASQKPVEDVDYSKFDQAYKKLIPYLDSIDMDKDSYTYGTVKVDENLQKILQELMDISTFEGVEGSWLKLCYFEVHLGSN